jgi:hypothetical protein
MASAIVSIRRRLSYRPALAALLPPSLPVPGDELVQPLLAPRRRQMSSTVSSSGSSLNLRQPDSADWRCGRIRVATSPGHGRSYRFRCALISVGWRQAGAHVPSGDPHEVRDFGGNLPTRVAGYPGAAGASEAVFDVGPGIRQFAGRELTEDPNR